MRLTKRSTDATETSGEASAHRRRRAGRGWEPFSGGQLTIMIVTFAVLLLLPVGAWAVSGTTVFVTDHTTGKTE